MLLLALEPPLTERVGDARALGEIVGVEGALAHADCVGAVLGEASAVADTTLDGEWDSVAGGVAVPGPVPAGERDAASDAVVDAERVSDRENEAEREGGAVARGVADAALLLLPLPPPDADAHPLALKLGGALRLTETERDSGALAHADADSEMAATDSVAGAERVILAECEAPADALALGRALTLDDAEMEGVALPRPVPLAVRVAGDERVTDAVERGDAERTALALATLALALSLTLAVAEGEAVGVEEGVPAHVTLTDGVAELLRDAEPEMDGVRLCMVKAVSELFALADGVAELLITDAVAEVDGVAEGEADADDEDVALNVAVREYGADELGRGEKDCEGVCVVESLSSALRDAEGELDVLDESDCAEVGDGDSDVDSVGVRVEFRERGGGRVGNGSPVDEDVLLPRPDAVGVAVCERDARALDECDGDADTLHVAGAVREAEADTLAVRVSVGEGDDDGERTSERERGTVADTHAEADGESEAAALDGDNVAL